MQLNQEQIDIMRHTDSHRSANGLYCGDSPDMQDLVKRGLMELAGSKLFVPDPYFRITSMGRTVLKEYDELKVKI